MLLKQKILHKTELKDALFRNQEGWHTIQTGPLVKFDHSKQEMIADVEDLQQQISFLKEERLRLQKKLEEIENLSKYAWEQVDRNPDEAKELFKMITFKSK